MSEWKVRKKMTIEMAHQLTSAYSKACHTLHGHSYTIEIFLGSDCLNSDNMVLDFGLVKETCGVAIDQYDHCVMLHDQMPKEYLSVIETYNDNVHIVPFNPTAEAMSALFLKECKEAMIFKFGAGFGKYVEKIRVHETATGYAEYTD